MDVRVDTPAADSGRITGYSDVNLGDQITSCLPTIQPNEEKRVLQWGIRSKVNAIPL